MIETVKYKCQISIISFNKLKSYNNITNEYNGVVFSEPSITILSFNVFESCYISLNVNACTMYHKGDKTLIK